MKKEVKLDSEVKEVVAQEVPSIVPEQLPESQKERNKRKIEEMRKRDRKMVRGRFVFHEVPGGVLPFNIKLYPGDPIERFELMDGEIYTIPLGIAKHLNTNCWFPVYEHCPTEKGIVEGILADPVGGVSKNMRVGRKVRRCSFQSLEFMELENVPSSESQIVSVERA